MRAVRPIVILTALILLAALVVQGKVHTCAYCKKQITQGEYLYDNNIYYHKACYYEHVAPRCAVCKKVIEGQHVVQDGNLYHETCYKSQIAIRCTYCDEVLMGAYLTTNWGENYCPEHKGKVPECLYCGRLIGDRHNHGGKTYADGRQVCGICLQTAVNTQSEAESLLAEVKERLGGLGIRIDVEDIPLQLVDRDELGRQFGDDAVRYSAFSKKDFHTWFGKEIRKRYSIYILDGMPRMHFIPALAHELMHVWQYENAPAGNIPQLCEGSCNYAALLVLRQIGGKEMEYQIAMLDNDNDPVYGDGYRRVRKLVEALGVAGWLANLKVDRGFPLGY